MKAKDAILMVTLVCSAIACNNNSNSNRNAELNPDKYDLTLARKFAWKFIKGVAEYVAGDAAGTNTPDIWPGTYPGFYPGIYPGILPVIPDKNVDVENPSESSETMMSIIKCIRKIVKIVKIIAAIFSGKFITGGPEYVAGPVAGDNTTNAIGGGEEKEATNPDVADKNGDVENPSESPESRVKPRGPARRVGTDTPDFWPGTYPGILPVIPDKNVDVKNRSRGIGKDFLKNIKTRYNPDW